MLSDLSLRPPQIKHSIFFCWYVVAFLPSSAFHKKTKQKFKKIPTKGVVGVWRGSRAYQDVSQQVRQRLRAVLACERRLL